MPGANELDVGAAVADIGAGLGFGSDDNGGGDDLDLDAGSSDGAGGDGGSAAAGGGGAPGGDPAGTTPEGDTSQVPADDATPPASGTPAPKPGQAPNTWKPEVAAKWAALDPEVQAEILRREDDMFKGIEGYKANAKIGEQFNQVIEPYKHILAHFKVDPVQQLSGLMKAHYTLATGSPEQRVQLFRHLAGQYGVDVSELSKDPPYVDPEVKRLTEGHQALESKFNQTQQELLREREAAAQQRVEAFEKETEADGKTLKRPYFKELEADVAAQLRAGAKDLQEAYDRAVWANPVTRVKEQQRLQQEADSKRKAEEKAKAEAARKATAANTRTTAKSGSAAAPLGSMDDTLRETLAKIEKRS